MGRVTGIGGVFFKAEDPKALRSWYQETFGFQIDDWGGVAFQWRDEGDAVATACTVWCPFEANTRYFDPSSKPFMINFRVTDLDGLIRTLQEKGHVVEPVKEETGIGRFAGMMDPEGNRLELWEPLSSPL